MLTDQAPKLHLSMENIRPFPETLRTLYFAAYNYDNLSDISYHNHAGYFELALVNRGYGYHYINGTVCEVSKGEAFFIDPKSYHSFYPIDSHNSSRLEVYNCVFAQKDLAALCESLPLLGEALAVFSDCTQSHALRCNNNFLGKELSGVCEYLFPRMAAYAQTPTPHTQSIAYLSLAQIILETSRHLTNPEASTCKESEHAIAAQALDYLHRNYADINLTMQSLYDHLFISKSHLCTLFKKSVGVTPVFYLNRLRIQKACAILRETPEALGDVHRLVGYCEYGTFYVNFKKHTGFCIRDYLKAVKTCHGLMDETDLDILAQNADKPDMPAYTVD